MSTTSILFSFESFDEQNASLENPLGVGDIIVDQPSANENSQTPPPEMFAKEAMETAAKEAFEKGKAAGFAEGKAAALTEINHAEQQLNQKISAALESLNIQLATLFDTVEHYNPERFIPSIQQLALGIARKIAGDSIRETAIQEIEDYINHSLGVLFDQPALTIYLHPELEATFMDRAKEFAVRNNFRGTIHIKPDANLPETDCRLDWHEGFSELSKEELWKNIYRALDTTFISE